MALGFLVAATAQHAPAQDVTIEDETITDQKIVQGATITLGPNVTIGASGDLTAKSKTLAIKTHFIVETCGKLQIISGAEPSAIDQDAPLTADEFIVHTNYPNPFNPATRIEYTLPRKVEVSIAVFNAAGRKVKTLISQRQSRGHHGVTWDGTDANGKPAGAGLYYYSIRSGGYHAAGKMVLLK